MVLAFHAEMVPALPLSRYAARSFTKCLETASFTPSAISSPYRLQIQQSGIRNLPRPHFIRRFFYGHISDPKMAPQLEPFFKQYVNRLSFTRCGLRLRTKLYATPGWTNCLILLLNVCASPEETQGFCIKCTHFLVKGLRKAVAIPSISAQEEHRKDVFKVCSDARYAVTF